jgi:hypothetical protein
MTAITDLLRFPLGREPERGRLSFAYKGLRRPLFAHDPRDGPVLRRRNADVGRKEMGKMALR